MADKVGLYVLATGMAVCALIFFTMLLTLQFCGGPAPDTSKQMPRTESEAYIDLKQKRLTAESPLGGDQSPQGGDQSPMSPR